MIISFNKEDILGPTFKPFYLWLKKVSTEVNMAHIIATINKNSCLNLHVLLPLHFQKRPNLKPVRYYTLNCMQKRFTTLKYDYISNVI